MKKSLLFAAFAACAITASAESQVYWFTAQNMGTEFDVMGMVYGVSDNGEYAVITDDEMGECYLWKKSDPQNLELLNWDVNGRQVPLEVRGVNDAGTIVGSYRPYQSNTWIPFYKELDAEVVNLPVPVWTLTMNFPCGISEDGNIIGGYLGKTIYSKTIMKNGEPDHWGGFWPVIWAKGADGEYECHYNEDLDMPDHQGFPANCMYTDGTLEGTWLGGPLNCGGGSTISAVYHNGEFTKWNDLDIVELPFYYQGKINGYYKYEVIDGKRDGYFSDSDYVNAAIYSVDRYGHFFGTRFHVGKLDHNDDLEDEDWGKSVGDSYTWGYYDIKTGEWTEKAGSTIVQTAIDDKVFFSNRNLYTDGINGPTENIATAYGISTNGKNWDGVNKANRDASVLGMSYTATDGAGVEHNYPFMVVGDALVNIDSIVADTEAKHVILTYGGTIEVAGANEVAVYDLNGAMVSDKAISNVGSGIYVVVADGKSHKIMVK